MSRICDICGKSAQVGNHRSHALNATKRRFYPNLHEIRAIMDDGVKRVKVCSSCLKANKVRKAVSK
ncbi:MAG: 50S ribosomal protein L28 [Candidatus Cloacimonadaceae bacterium]|jgi:large subunit ribosomal protein L28|nr:50S ribosomal protein L28 [Candidatus Cloacimonadota bacterium]MDY0127052.1 50S ribosomal protein L28 [Candidatus Cloacimonadaceae bacterium]MCB5255663.1 50S ribosomal protein L28 [Candidatus Cloacimonadota bacterium]MCK9178456.1 50S ribosomal protein L28 [Candidatus Cloacimonadota bacterium]MCK9242619.1 50S ribosomal protein L28 [Candidatus Cloacimonadota bacterium]